MSAVCQKCSAKCFQCSGNAFNCLSCNGLNRTNLIPDCLCLEQNAEDGTNPDCTYDNYLAYLEKNKIVNYIDKEVLKPVDRCGWNIFCGTQFLFFILFLVLLLLLLISVYIYYRMKKKSQSVADLQHAKIQ